VSAQILGREKWNAATVRRWNRGVDVRQAELAKAAPKRLTLDDILDRFEPWGGDHAA
jgi:hypothetical protein